MPIILEALTPEYVDTLAEFKEAADDCRHNKLGPVVLRAHDYKEIAALANKYVKDFTSFATDYTLSISSDDTMFDEIDRLSGGLYSATRKIVTPNFISSLNLQTTEGDHEPHFDGFIEVKPDTVPQLSHHYTFYGSSLIAMARVNAESARELCDYIALEEQILAHLDTVEGANDELFTDSLIKQFYEVSQGAYFRVEAGQIVAFPGRGEYGGTHTLFPDMHHFMTTSSVRGMIICEAAD